MKPRRPSYPENEPIKEGALDKVIYHRTRRPNGTLRIQQDFEFCPSQTEQVGETTDLNYLVKKYQPDELAAYVAAKNAHRIAIENHDWSQEPSLQEAKNIGYRLRQAFESLPDEVRGYFSNNHFKFLKFIDNPANQHTMIKLGLLKERQIADLATPTPTTTQEETKAT